MELAHWLYLDEIAVEGTGLPQLDMAQFTFEFFRHNVELRDHADRTGEILTAWKKYKDAIPTFGCLLVSYEDSHIILESRR